MEMVKHTMVVIAIATILFATTTVSNQLVAAAFLKIKHPDGKEQVKAYTPIQVTGTASPSNATHTKCNVQVQWDGNGYALVTPQGSPPNPFTIWATLIPPQPPGKHEVEGQFQCVGTNGVVNFTKHLVHNFTATTGPIGIGNGSGFATPKTTTTAPPLSPH